ncbi:peroxide stress protein YaaA [Aquihabitans sp. G128]|uniref:YaaA family protein n=1 Tax=Aquihabitans sp. G128 TaxID=2849779 RepID=UPI001C210067|nr:peroxide stress protein YaaA [Aquihabitans sp. G128]QXC61682.1 peroxide stress protein YaaA [Aquihabitans sp. G128]
MAARTVILLPPSEGKAPGGRGAPWAPGRLVLPELDDRRAQVLAALGEGHPARTSGTRPAIDRYTGVLYRELDAASLDGAARNRLTRQALIASGLWGVVGPRDPIPDYKLKMGARVAPLGTLSGWWRPALTAALRDRVGGAVVWDLLPNEHAAAIDWSQLAPRTRVQVRFLDRQGKVVSHWNKLLKGSIVRWLVETGTNDPAALAGFDHPQGYRLDGAASTFARREVSLVLREGEPSTLG